MVANFEHPGLNLAGTFSYADAQASARGAQNLVMLKNQLQSYSFLMALLGLAQPLRRLEAQANDKETKFVAEVDGRAVMQGLEFADKMLPLVTKPRQTSR
jgi:hypothetical protein